jgi:hypothetical protein
VSTNDMLVDQRNAVRNERPVLSRPRAEFGSSTIVI